MTIALFQQPHPSRTTPRAGRASRTARSGISRVIAIAVAGCLALSFPALAGDHPPPPHLPDSGSTFFDANDQPLPLTEDELLEFLRTAEVTKTKVLATGINGTQKLTLEQNGLIVHAVFRTVNMTLKDNDRQGHTNRFAFRDSYKFEVAAYRLSRLLQIHRVPPAVFRTVDSKRGSIQLWIENAMTAADAIKDGIAQRRPAQRHLQRQLMYGFDLLVFNFDRHYGNILYDQRDRMWFIDHTRSFKRLPQLRREQRPILGDQRFYKTLRDLEPGAIKAQMNGALSKIETDALLRRRKLLLKHFDQLIAERGRDKVIVDVDRVYRPLEKALPTRLVTPASSYSASIVFDNFPVFHNQAHILQ